MNFDEIQWSNSIFTLVAYLMVNQLKKPLAGLLLLMSFSASAGADASASLGTQVKTDAVTAGQAVAHAARAVGHAVAQGTREAGHVIVKSARQVKDKVENALHKKPAESESPAD